jgi:hypothetical protein
MYRVAKNVLPEGYSSNDKWYQHWILYQMKARQKWDLSIRIDKGYKDFLWPNLEISRSSWITVMTKIFCHEERSNHIRYRNTEYSQVMFTFFDFMNYKNKHNFATFNIFMSDVIWSLFVTENFFHDCDSWVSRNFEIWPQKIFIVLIDSYG